MDFLVWGRLLRGFSSQYFQSNLKRKGSSRERPVDLAHFIFLAVAQVLPCEINVSDRWMIAGYLVTCRQSLLNLPSIKALIISPGPTFQNVLLVFGLADTLVPHSNQKVFLFFTSSCDSQTDHSDAVFRGSRHFLCLWNKEEFTSQSSSQRNFFYASDFKRNLKHLKKGKTRKCMWIKINIIMRVMLIEIFLLMCKHVMMRCLIWNIEQHLLVLRRLFLTEAQSPSLIANSKYKGALQSSSYSAGGILFLFFPKQNKKANHVDYVPNVFITPPPASPNQKFH